jgi:ribose-phosphate pyrophosphokinase
MKRLTSLMCAAAMAGRIALAYTDGGQAPVRVRVVGVVLDFFDVPVDNVYGSPVLLEDIEKQNFEDLIVVSPDIGGVVRARAVAKQLGIDLAIIDKRRPHAGVAEVMNIIGDVNNRTCLLVDDMVDTAGTLCNAAKALKKEGAKKVVAYCTHPVLSGKAITNIDGSELDELVVTDSIPLSDAARNCSRIRQLTLSRMLAEAVRRLSNEESLSAMFR